MKRRLTYMWSCLIVSVLCLTGSATCAEPPVLRVNRCDDFSITGSGDAGAWDRTAWVALNKRDTSDATQHEYQARFKMLYSDSGLYVLFDGTDNKLTATKMEDFADLWTEDVYECFFWTDTRYPLYFEYEISPLGYELPILIPNFEGEFLGWRPWNYDGERRIQKKVTVRGGPQQSMAQVDGWRAEIFIPYDLLRPLRNIPPKPGTQWRANFYRVDYDADRSTAWDWSRVGESFHDIANFGVLSFQ